MAACVYAGSVISCLHVAWQWSRKRRCKENIMGDEFDIVTKQGRKDVLEANMCCLIVSKP